MKIQIDGISREIRVTNKSLHGFTDFQVLDHAGAVLSVHNLPEQWIKTGKSTITTGGHTYKKEV